MNRRSRWLFGLLLVLPLGGCISVSSGHRHAHPAAHAKAGGEAGASDEDGDMTHTVGLTARERRDGERETAPAKPATGDPGDTAEPPTDEEPLASDPHSERPGAEEDEAPPEPRAVSFVAPDPKLRPVRPERRPSLPAHAALALATVHAGEVVLDSEAVLALDVLLSKESALATLVGLEPPPLARASLKDLAKAAYARKRDLLLVDVLPQIEGEERVGFLLDARTGVLLARWTVATRGDPSTPASSDAAPDLCERLARSYALLTQ